MAKIEKSEWNTFQTHFSRMINLVRWEFFAESPNPNSSLNTSLGLNASMLNGSSPNIANMSERFKFLMPEKSLSKHRYSFSPMDNNSFARSPNLSPIANSPSNFIKRRDPKNIK